jgi:hypothetical protein
MLVKMNAGRDAARITTPTPPFIPGFNNAAIALKEEI